MGWGSGAEVADRVWACVKDRLKPGTEERVAQELVGLFESMDCDTMFETAVGEVAGKVLVRGYGTKWAWEVKPGDVLCTPDEYED